MKRRDVKGCAPTCCGFTTYLVPTNPACREFDTAAAQVMFAVLFVRPAYSRVANAHIMADTGNRLSDHKRELYYRYRLHIGHVSQLR